MKKYNSKILLIVILFFAFITRIWQLHFPEQYIFDEVYHGATSKLIAHNDPRAYEWWHPGPEPNTAIDWLHPPLAKYTQAIGILIFGENTFGWRISSAVFGVGVIYLTFVLAKKLFNEEVGLMAAFIASLDGLLLTQSRIAMNDIHVTFFILLTLIVYLIYREKATQLQCSKAIKRQSKIKTQITQKSVSRWLFLTGISAGLAMGSKWSGFFVLATVAFFETAEMVRWLYGLRGRRKQPLSHRTILIIRELFTRFLFLLVIPFTVYVLSYSHMFLQGKSLFCNQKVPIEGKCYYEVIKWGDKVLYQGYISHFNELHRQIWHYQTHLEATHTYQSRPYQWFFNLRPVWYYVKYGDNTLANIYAFGNPAVFLLGAMSVLLTTLYLFVLSATHLLQTSNFKFLISKQILKIKFPKNKYLSSLVFIFLDNFKNLGRIINF
jgi:dolichyl-phosphate-mannose--protein O-mannosyl transferase